MKNKWSKKLEQLEKERVEMKSEWEGWIAKKDTFMERQTRRDLSVIEGKIEIVKELLEDLSGMEVED